MEPEIKPRRPGIEELVKRIASQNPTWPEMRVQAEAKAQWEQRRVSQR